MVVFACQNGCKQTQENITSAYNPASVTIVTPMGHEIHNMDRFDPYYVIQICEYYDFRLVLFVNITIAAPSFLTASVVHTLRTSPP